MVVFANARKIRLRPFECSTHPPCCHNECAGTTCGLVTLGGQSQSNVSTGCETRFGFTQRIEADSSDSQCSGEPVFTLLYERLHDDRESAARLIWRSAFRLHSSGVLRARSTSKLYTLMHERRLFHRFNWPLPISLALRNGLVVVLLLSSIAVFWQPLSALYVLTREQSHYSHLLLVPFVSAYVFYQQRKVILTSGEWSPVSGLMMVGLGAFGYWEAARVTNGVDYVSLSTLALVIVTWGIFLFCYGPGICRTFSFGLFFLLCMVPFPAGLLHTIIVFLQRSAVEGIDLGFSLLNVPVIRDDTVFVLQNITIRRG